MTGLCVVGAYGIVIAIAIVIVTVIVVDLNPVNSAGLITCYAKLVPCINLLVP